MFDKPTNLHLNRLTYTFLHAMGQKPWRFFMLKTVLRGVENPMFFCPQSAERPPPIGFPLRGIRAA